MENSIMTSEYVRTNNPNSPAKLHPLEHQIYKDEQ